MKRFLSMHILITTLLVTTVLASVTLYFAQLRGESRRMVLMEENKELILANKQLTKIIDSTLISFISDMRKDKREWIKKSEVIEKIDSVKTSVDTIKIINEK